MTNLRLKTLCGLVGFTNAGPVVGRWQFKFHTEFFR